MVNWVITPGLLNPVMGFEALFKHCKSSITPIIVYGDTGTGKSLFRNLFIHLYRQTYPDEKTHPIQVINCSQFGNDVAMARSEIFGHLKGAFTGAAKDKDGLVKALDGGVLILEEIGDLPEPVQALLLTYTETGEYVRLGGVETQKSKTWLFGLTNKQEALRRDFFYRFEPFLVPPLATRRQDVLYYLAHMNTDLVKSLTGQDVLTLLSYSWPGSVREIRSLVSIFEQRHIYNQSWEKKRNRINLKDLSWIPSVQLSIDFDVPSQLLNKLIFIKIDIEELERDLNHYYLGLKDNNNYLPFDKEIMRVGYHDESLQQYGIPIMAKHPMIEKAYEGYQLFCAIIGQYPDESENALSLDFFTPMATAKYFDQPQKQENLSRGSRMLLQFWNPIKDHFFEDWAGPSEDGKYLRPDLKQDDKDGIENTRALELFLSTIVHTVDFPKLQMIYWKSVIQRTSANSYAELSRQTKVSVRTIKRRLLEYGLSLSNQA